MTIELPAYVRAKAISEGQQAWIDALPSLVAAIAGEWRITVGRTLTGGSEAYVAEATLDDGTPAILKLLIPRYDEVAINEITVLRLANGEGCVRLFQSDESRFAMLLERLGRSLFDLKLPVARRQEILAGTAMAVWRPAPDAGLPTGAEKGRWLIDYILHLWEEIDRPCSRRAVDYAIACAERRIAAHDNERAVLVHGDVHQWNTLEATPPATDDAPPATAFKLVDPDGLLAEPEYDLGVLLREDPVALMQGDPRERARWLAARTGRDAAAIWEWGAVERVSTGLLCTKLDMQPGARDMLAAAELAATA